MRGGAYICAFVDICALARMVVARFAIADGFGVLCFIVFVVVDVSRVD